MTRCSLFNLREAFKGKLKRLRSSTSSRSSTTLEPDQNGPEISPKRVDTTFCEPSSYTSSKIATLPVELQLEILGNLDITDLIAVRSTNKSLRAVVQDNENYLCRQHIKEWPQDSVYRLYFPSEGPSIRCLMDLASKTSMADELSHEIAIRAVEDLLSSPTHWFLPEVRVMAIGLLKAKFRNAILILFHFFEQYNNIKQAFGDNLQLQKQCGISTTTPLFANYTDSQLRLANQMCDLLLKMLSLPSIVDDPMDDGNRNQEPISKAMVAIMKLWGIPQGSDQSKFKFGLKAYSWMCAGYHPP